MPDPLDALRLADEPVAPRPAFARGLVTKIHDELTVDSSVSYAFAAEGSSANATAYDALDEALEVVAGTGPEYDPFGTGFCLTNHAPMVAEALCALGRPDAVRPWVNRYRKYLSDAPARAARSSSRSGVKHSAISTGWPTGSSSSRPSSTTRPGAR